MLVKDQFPIQEIEAWSENSLDLRIINFLNNVNISGVDNKQSITLQPLGSLHVKLLLRSPCCLPLTVIKTDDLHKCKSLVPNSA